MRSKMTRTAVVLPLALLVCAASTSAFVLPFSSASTLDSAEEAYAPDPFSDPDGDSVYLAWSQWRAGRAVTEGSVDGEGEVGVQGMQFRAEGGGGWIGGWFSSFGEGQMVVQIDPSHNLTVPHRPASFPSHLPSSHTLPTAGRLVRVTDLPVPSWAGGAEVDMYGCLPTMTALASSSSLLSPLLAELPGTTDISGTGIEADKRNRTIALVLRGRCPFSQKVLSAQERGADGVIVADDAERRPGGQVESDEEGRRRTGLLTMYSPEDTENIHIPSLFISRASYLAIRDILDAQSGEGGPPSVMVDIQDSEGWEWPLSDLMVVVLLLPTIFTFLTIMISRIRAIRQKKLDRAPATIVSSLPERLWTPEDWEKEDDDLVERMRTSTDDSAQLDSPATSPIAVPPKPRSSAHDQPVASGSNPSSHTPRHKYFSKDECAICLQEFQRGEKIRILPCGHLFHKEEVDDWLIRWKKLCPVCRTDVTQPFNATPALASSAASSSSSPMMDPARQRLLPDEAGARVGPRTPYVRRFVRYVSSGLSRQPRTAAVEQDIAEEQPQPTEATPLIRRDT